MNKEDILLKNYSILIKNPMKNADAIKAIVEQFCIENPKLSMSCWLELLQSNKNELKNSFVEDDFEYGTFGYEFVSTFENDLLYKENFKYALGEFVKCKQLLEILYSDFSISKYTKIFYPIAYLIRNQRLQEANTLLSYIYKNRRFSNYSDLWKNIIDRFRYTDLDNYCGGGFVIDNCKQDAEIQDFCMSWVERITDEEEQAGAMAHVMRIF